MSMLNAVIIVGMSIVSFIIKHSHISGRNVMLRSVSDRIDGGARASVCGRSGRFCQVCVFFVGNPSVVGPTDVGGDGSGVCFSASAGQPHHSITL